jgi:hypothetical protein
MAGGHGESSGGGGTAGWRRFSEFWLTLPGVLTGIAAILGAMAALLTATHFGPDPPDPSPATTTEGPTTVPLGVPCSDGKDNDGDGKTDFPQDRGCSSAKDPAEKDPPCSDGKDNDEDGKTDFPQDPGCSSAEDMAEKQ